MPAFKVPPSCTCSVRISWRTSNARFQIRFLDRPIFATVLSVVITLIGGAALAYLPIAQYPRITPPGVVVAITYPGASARVVADTVAAPIEQAHRSIAVAHLGNISLRVGRDIRWDPDRERIIGDETANQMLSRPMRKPWALPV